MQDIQDIFNRIQEIKKQQKDIRSAYKESLEGSLEYKEIGDKIKTLRERKKQIENTTKESFSSEFTKLDDFKIEFQGHSMHVINSPSPAATASLAYGNEIAIQAKAYFKLS